MSKPKGFTYVEIIVVVGILASLFLVGLETFSGVMKRNRDTKRLTDLNKLVSLITAYEVQFGRYPGEADVDGVHISPGCASNFQTDLIDANYIKNVPSDPLSDNLGCAVRFDEPNIDDAFFYGWDSQNAVQSFCLSINNLETDWAIDQLVRKYDTQLAVTGEGDANIGTGSTMQFNYCFVIN